LENSGATLKLYRTSGCGILESSVDRKAIRQQKDMQAIMHFRLYVPLSGILESSGDR
jgi:hypothetical protein